MTRALLVGLLLLGACEPPAVSWDANKREAVPIHRRREIVAPADAAPKALRVMAWNIKYGAGQGIDFWFDLWGDRVQMTRTEVEHNLDGVHRLINEVNPDVLMVEEIEINSRRSAYVNMVTGILEHTNLNYAAYFPNWRSRYIPSEGLGRMDLGNAIFSRYPIKSTERIPQIDRSDVDALTRTFYIHRAVGRVVLDVGRDVAALVVHTEAYDDDGTKGKQLVQIAQLMDAETGPFVIGGDFNSVPPGTVDLGDFNDVSPKAKGTDFDQKPYPPDEMRPFYDRFLPHLTLDRYGTTRDQQRQFYSHSLIPRERTGSRGQPGFWTRTLDYLIVRAPDSWQPGSTDNLQDPGRLGITSDPMTLSDHTPVVGTWVVAP